MKYAIRSMYIAPKGSTFIAFDLSQAETWCVAHLANEQSMIDALMYGDIHSSTAVLLYAEQHSGCKHRWNDLHGGSKQCKFCQVIITKIQRYPGKQNNHAQSYRMGYLRLAEVFNKNSDKPPYMTVANDEAKRMARLWHGYYNLKPWWNEVEIKLGVNRTLTTCYGFRRTFFAPWGDELFKEATAFEPQSTVADHAFGAVHPELGITGGILGVRTICHKYSFKLVHTAHDSIMIEVPDNDKLISDVAPQFYQQMHRPLIINGHEFTIPVDGEVGDRWGEMEKMEPTKLAA